MRARDDEGSAIIEFVFVAVIVLVPLVYAIAAVALGQRNLFAVRDAAREAGRAFATTDSAATGQQTDRLAVGRARAAVRLSLANQGLSDDAQLLFVAAGAPCDAPPVTPIVRPGAEYTICVRRRMDLPGVPSVLAGRSVVTVGRYLVHIDDFRAPTR